MSLPTLNLENFEIAATGETDKLSKREKEKVSQLMAGFLKGNKHRFNEAHLHLHVKEHKETFRSRPLMYAVLKLTTDRGTFHSSDDDWGAEQAVRKNLEHLGTQIEKKFGKMKTRTTIRKESAGTVVE